MQSPTIARYMTRQPWTIGSRASVFDATLRMREHGIRHLPVVDDGRVVGIVSDRDITWVQSTYRDPATKVHEAMTERPYVVGRDALLADVARHMSAHKYGSAVVASDGTVEGIFTAVDACRALAELLTPCS